MFRPRIVWTLSSGTSGKGNQKSRANPRFSRKMAGKKYEKTDLLLKADSLYGKDCNQAAQDYGN